MGPNLVTATYLLRELSAVIQSATLPELVQIAGAMASIHSAALARFLAAMDVAAGGSVTGTNETGRLLTVNEAAAASGLPTSFFYRQAGSLPFTRRPTPGRLRFYEPGLREWLARRG